MHNSEEFADYIWLIALVITAALLRLYQLGDTPFHHDESIHAYLSYLLWEGHPYRFDPIYHGPLLYWSNAVVYSLFGDSDFTARLLPASCSIALLLPVWLLRTQLGSIGWKVAAAFLVLSPTLTYYGRFLAHDNYAALFTLLLVYLGMASHRQPSIWSMASLGFVLGLFLATKAVVYINLGLFVAFALLVYALDTFAPEMPRARLRQLSLQWLLRRRHHIVIGLLLMLAVYVAFYSSFFTHWAGVPAGVFGTLSYWSGQHLEPRIPGPVYYYLPRLILHEPVFLLAAPSLAWVARGRHQPFDTFLAFWMLSTLAVYGYAQEKVPWLLVHMLIPMLLLAGRWVDHSWRLGRSKLAWCVTLLLLLSWSAHQTIRLCFQLPPATPHLLTYMATTTEMKQAALYIRSLDPTSGQVFLSDKAAWPMAWYLRDRDVTFELPIGWEQTAILVEAGEGNREKIVAQGFSGQTYPLMGWWYPDLWRLFSRELPAYLGHQDLPESRDIYRFTLYQRPGSTSMESKHD